MRPVLQLLCYLTICNNRACNQLRKHADVSAEPNRGGFRSTSLPVDIYQVRNGLKGVKADAGWQQKFRCSKLKICFWNQSNQLINAGENAPLCVLKIIDA